MVFWDFASDGIHDLTLEVCDNAGHCISETRTIELTNLAPELNVSFDPSLTQWNELIMPQTGTVSINTTGTFDPEGDDFAASSRLVVTIDKVLDGAINGFVQKC